MTAQRRRPLSASLIAGAALLAVATITAGAINAQPAEPRAFALDVAHEGWTDTGITLAVGEGARLTVTGEAFWEPGFGVGPAGAPGATCDLFEPSGLTGALLARVGSGAAVPGDGSVTLEGPGRIFLLYNDCPTKYFDNSGTYTVSFALGPLAARPAATVAPAPTTEAAPSVEPTAPVVTSETDAEGSIPAWRVLGPLLALIAVGWLLFRLAQKLGVLAPLLGRLSVGAALPQGQVDAFDPLARLESSAWLAPMRLGLIQGEKRPKKFLTIGGPDADIDFGVPGIWARLYPTPDGGARIEKTTTADRIVIDGTPLVLSQRLKPGAQVQMGTRAFTYRGDKEDGPRVTAFGRYTNDLERPDPREEIETEPRAGGRFVRESFRAFASGATDPEPPADPARPDARDEVSAREATAGPDDDGPIPGSEMWPGRLWRPEDDGRAEGHGDDDARRRFRAS